jgi:ATP synthase F1 delta subunit
VTDKLIAERYAKALIRLMEQADFDAYLKDIEYLHDVFGNSDYAKTLNSFLFPKKERMELAHQILENVEKKEIWQNLFTLLIHKHRFSLISAILEQLELAIYEQKKTKKVHLILAKKQPENIVELIRKKIESIIGMKILFKTTFDPSIIGGFIAKTDSFIIDGSIHHNLIKLTKIAEF